MFEKVAEKVGQLEHARIYIEEINGLNKIEELQEHENEEVYKLAYHMVEKFFSDEEVSSSITFYKTKNTCQTIMMFFKLFRLMILHCNRQPHRHSIISIRPYKVQKSNRMN